MSNEEKPTQTETPAPEARDIVSLEKRYGLFIGGELVTPKSKEWFPTISPSTEEQLAEVAKEYKIYYKKVDGKTPDSYTMDHSAGSYVYDPQGRVRLYTRYGTGPEALASDLKVLLKGA